MSDAVYIHGTHPEEQDRLAKLGELTDAAFLRFLDLDGAAAVLDVGSGLGVLARTVAQRLPRAQVWGVERSAEQLARARADLPNLHFVRADAHALPFGEGQFDVVYCRYLLEHVGDPARVVREMHRVLKPGGKVFVQENNILINAFDPETPHFDAVWRQFARLQALLGGDACVGRRLLPLLRGAGLQDVVLSIQPEVHWSGTPTFRPWVENLLNNVLPAEAQLVARGLATADEVRAAARELRRLMDNDAGSAFFYWNRATGRKAPPPAGTP